MLRRWLLVRNFKVAATTLRAAKTATLNAWGAMQLRDEILYAPQPEIEIMDRVGGGDTFASGLIYGTLMGKPAAGAVACGVADGALAMTTPGDTSTASRAEVERVMLGGSARIAR